MQHVMEYGDGHLLSYADEGDRGSDPVLVQHGMVASIRDAPHLFARLLDAGIRVPFCGQGGWRALLEEHLGGLHRNGGAQEFRARPRPVWVIVSRLPQ